jgi:hypothetical protein
MARPGECHESVCALERVIDALSSHGQCVRSHEDLVFACDRDNHYSPHRPRSIVTIVRPRAFVKVSCEATQKYKLTRSWVAELCLRDSLIVVRNTVVTWTQDV